MVRGQFPNDDDDNDDDDRDFDVEYNHCLLYSSDASDDLPCLDLFYPLFF